jgi:hypothetical protein
MFEGTHFPLARKPQAASCVSRSERLRNRLLPFCYPTPATGQDRATRWGIGQS